MPQTADERLETITRAMEALAKLDGVERTMFTDAIRTIVYGQVDRSSQATIRAVS